ncbi:hypothetical protein NECAME_17641, partial [Necator americanus]
MKLFSRTCSLPFSGFSVLVFYVVESNRYAEQLYEDLLYYYNKNVRPVKNASESIKVKFGASLIRIIDVVSCLFESNENGLCLNDSDLYHKLWDQSVRNSVNFSFRIPTFSLDEVNQVLTTNLWLEMQWFDYKLSWDPIRWGGIRKLHIPSDQIWIPDILLYN